MKSARWFVSYIAVAFVGLGLAFVFSLRFLAPAHSQDTKNLEAPSSGELPPEFMNEVNKTQVPPAAPKASPPAAQAPATPPPTVPEASVPVEASATDEATAPAPLPTTGLDGYVYDPTGRRDPFAPYRTGNTPGQRATVKEIPLEPLQRWDTERLKVIGILWEVNNPRAMLRDPDGHVYTIIKNSKVGRNNGYVAAIREGEVVVVETMDVEGTTSKETKVLELGK